MKISEMKKEALSALSGKYKTFAIISVLVFAISSIYSIISPLLTNAFVQLLVYTVYLLVFLLLSYGLAVLALKTIRNEDINISDFINMCFGNVKGVYRVTFKTILYLILPLICIIASSTFLLFSIFSAILSESFSAMILIALVAFVASFIYLLVVSLSYVLTSFLLYDNPTATGKEINQTSKQLMKGFKGKYFLTYLSFLGWILLISIAAQIISMAFPQNAMQIASVVLANLGTAILFPYLNTTMACFYEKVSLAKTNATNDTTNV